MPPRPELHVVDDPAVPVAELLAEQARRGGSIVLTGGSSPGPAYERAAALAPDWGNVTLWWGDDRCVAPEHEWSNYRLAKETLLDRLRAQPTVHRIGGELGAPEAAELYHRELDGVRLDLALNGIGADGHTASLFPGAPALEERERRAVAAEPGLEPFVERVTLTPPVFAATRLLVYLVTGKSKAEAVRHAFAEEPNADTPASLIRGVETMAILDAAAASQLPHG
jgi:6-phosphogluconolactonase